MTNALSLKDSQPLEDLKIFFSSHTLLLTSHLCQQTQATLTSHHKMETDVFVRQDSADKVSTKLSALSSAPRPDHSQFHSMLTTNTTSGSKLDSECNTKLFKHVNSRTLLTFHLLFLLQFTFATENPINSQS